MRISLSNFTHGEQEFMQVRRKAVKVGSQLGIIFDAISFGHPWYLARRFGNNFFHSPKSFRQAFGSQYKATVQGCERGALRTAPRQRA